MGMVKGSGSSAIHQLFSYDASGNVVSVDCSSNGGSTFTTYYYLRNAQNDVVKLIDGSGNTVVEYRYDSWGKLVATTGTLATTLGANNPFRYRGYVYDTETGWYYLQSRYYNPEIGRFISSDVLLSIGQGVLGHNSYSYCGNNPINRIDSEGTLWNILAAVVGAVVGAAISVVANGVANVINGDNFFDDAGKSAISGAISGGLAGFTAGASLAITTNPVAQVAIDSAIGGAINVVSDLAVGNINSWGDALVSFGTGAISSGIVSTAGKLANYTTKRSFNSLSRSSKKNILAEKVFKNGNKNRNVNLKLYRESAEFAEYCNKKVA